MLSPGLQSPIDRRRGRVVASRRRSPGSQPTTRHTPRTRAPRRVRASFRPPWARGPYHEAASAGRCGTARRPLPWAAHARRRSRADRPAAPAEPARLPHQARRTLGGEANPDLRKAAERILGTLGGLKGAALTLGQALAMDPDALT